MTKPTNFTVEFMKQNHIPLTRENYLHIEYMGTPPEEIGGEIEAEIDLVFAALDDEFLMSAGREAHGGRR